MKTVSDKKINRKARFQKRFYRFVAIIYSIYANMKPDVYPRGGHLPEGGNLILANHVTKLDQFLVAMYYETSCIRFVSGENVFRNLLFRSFAVNWLNVIIHMRGVSSYDTIREMSKSLKAGDNVMIFPTGAMTFDGKSQKIDPAIAKLAKMSSCNLILLKSNGGYFFQPRWGVTTRKGKISLTEHVITADELRSMSASEVTTAIYDNLYTNAYEEQANARMKYTGKKLCKGLECCIYECPECGEITNLTTSDTNLNCKCGFSAAYDEYGYLNDRNGSSYTITELCEKQFNNLRDKFENARKTNAHEFLFADDFELKHLYHNGKREAVGSIKVSVYSDLAEYEYNNKKGTISYDEIDSLFVYMRNTLDIHIRGYEYGFELYGGFSSNTLKYRDLYNIITES